MDNHPDNLLLAVTHIYPELPNLLGPEDWRIMAPAIDKRLAQLQDNSYQPERLKLTVDLVGMLAPYQKARERLRQTLQTFDLRSELLLSLATLAANSRQPATTVDALRQAAIGRPAEAARLVTVSAGGTRATSIKLANLQFDLGAAAELVAGLLAAISDLAGKQNPLLQAAGLLLILRSLQKLSSVTLSEQEATVFYGLVLACDRDRTAGKAAILQHTNHERAKVGLPALTPAQLENALFNLTQLECVQRDPAAAGRWRVIERYTIKHPIG